MLTALPQDYQVYYFILKKYGQLMNDVVLIMRMTRSSLKLTVCYRN